VIESKSNAATVTITNRGPAAGLSWFVTYHGVERGPYSQGEVLSVLAQLMEGTAAVEAANERSREGGEQGTYAAELAGSLRTAGCEVRETSQPPGGES
jgi:hypothetical protein